MYDASDRKQVRAAEKAAKRAEREDREVLVNLMSTTQGRKWVWNLLASLGIFESPVVPGDPYATYLLIGEQNAGKRLLGQVMQWCPEEFTLAMREANARRSQSEPGRDTSGDAAGDPSAAEYPRVEEPGREFEGYSDPASGTD